MRYDEYAKIREFLGDIIRGTEWEGNVFAIGERSSTTTKSSSIRVSAFKMTNILSRK